MSRLRRWPLLLLASAVLLGACTPPAAGTPAATRTPSRTPTPPPTVRAASALDVDESALRGLVIDLWHPWFSGVEVSLLQSLVETFNRENQWGIEVALTPQINYTNLFENVTTSLPTPSRPDLVLALPEHARLWDANGYVVDLTPYVNDPAYGWDPEAQRDFPSVFWAQDDAAAGRVALPAQRTARFLLWNESWADTLGFDSPPDIPEDFEQQACRAHQSQLTDPVPDNDGTGGWLIDVDAMTALSWLLAFEGGVLEGDGYRFLTPNNIEAFGYLKQLQQAGCAWRIQPGGDPIAAFADRQTLFVTAGLETFADQSRAFSAAGSRDRWRPLALPGVDQDALMVYGSSYVMLESNAAEQLAGWLFVRWMLEPENDARWVRATGLFPLRSSTIELLNDYAAGHPQWAEAVDLISVGQIQPQLPSWRTVKVMLSDGFDCLFRGTPQCEQAPVVLRQMESIAQDLSQ